MFCWKKPFIMNSVIMSAWMIWELISPSGNPDAWIHHNVFYHRAEVPFVRPHMMMENMWLRRMKSI